MTASFSESKFYEFTRERFERAAELVGLSEKLHAILSEPKSVIQVNFPVRLDDDSYRIFQGYRIQHNNILGPYKGGIRYHPAVSDEGGQGVGRADDLEVCSRRPAARRRQGRRSARPACAQRR